MKAKPKTFEDEILARVKKHFPQQVKIRRHLHQYPEVSNSEFKTTLYLRRQVEKLGLKIIPIKMETGLLAELRGEHPGKTIALRTDIDALPITEQSGVPFESKNNGTMHACGHDLHMASILGAARVLSDMKRHLHGNVRFLFQPAEEKPPGGARPMIENGALKEVSIIFAMHNDPLLPTGRISLRDGIVMASVIDFDLIIHGRGSHAARPQSGVDAITTAAEVIEAVQKVISREISPMTPATVSFGTIEGGTARNVIADRVTITGTARAVSARAARDVPRLIKRTATAICKGRGARLEMKILASYPVLSNHKNANQILARNYVKLFGAGKIDETKLMLGAEDFAMYLQKVPGAMFRMGVMNKKIGADKTWHSPEYIADENGMIYGTALLVASTLDFLSRQNRGK